jgi:hypothetical protein
MRAFRCALVLLAAQSAPIVFAHGPQIQITADDGKIVTRSLLLDAPYSNTLTARKSVYVMPALMDLNGVWYSRPNSAIDPITGLYSFPSGPGFAYGYDLADGGTQQFATGSVFSLGFTDGLKSWNGAAFTDAGATQLKAFRGSSVGISSPPENFAITSDSAPFDNLSLPTVAANYGADGAEVHSSLRFALLGDGANAFSAVPDGVYLLSMQLSSTQIDLAASDPFYFVLSKNASTQALFDAVNSLGASSSAVQWVSIPEPSFAALATASVLLLVRARFRRGRRC